MRGTSALMKSWYWQKSKWRQRRERKDALANPDEQCVGSMPSCKANNELPCVRDHLTGQRDEIDADRFHAARGPFGSQDQPLHRRV